MRHIRLPIIDRRLIKEIETALAQEFLGPTDLEETGRGLKLRALTPIRSSLTEEKLEVLLYVKSVDAFFLCNIEWYGERIVVEIDREILTGEV